MSLFYIALYLNKTILSILYDLAANLDCRLIKKNLIIITI